MTRYDDEAVITLLKESVPQPPDVPDRAGSVRRLAAHRQRLLATQTVGCVALVVALVGGTVLWSGRLIPHFDDPIAASAAAMANETSFRYEFVNRITTRGGDGPTARPWPGPADIEARVQGAFDVRANVGRAEFTHVYTNGAEVSGTDTVRGEMLHAGGYVYERTRDTDTWTRSPLDARTASVRSVNEMVRQTLEGVTSTRRLGTDRIRGVRTVRYALERPPDRTGVGSRRELLWLDGDGRIRRWEREATFQDGETTGVVFMTIDLYDYGVPVSVTPPPAADVRD